MCIFAKTGEYIGILSIEFVSTFCCSKDIVKHKRDTIMNIYTIYTAIIARIYQNKDFMKQYRYIYNIESVPYTSKY